AAPPLRACDVVLYLRSGIRYRLGVLGVQRSHRSRRTRGAGNRRLPAKPARRKLFLRRDHAQTAVLTAAVFATRPRRTGRYLVMADERRRFTGKTAVVTGGGSGLGRAMAAAFALEGAEVCVVGRRQEKLDETVALVAKDGGKAFGLAADVRDAARVEAVMRE